MGAVIHMRNPVKGLYIVLSFIFLGLGVLGAMLPVLPTTPFLLLSSGFAVKGSDRVNKWIIGTKFYKRNIESFAKSKTMSSNTKRKILIFATVLLAAAFYTMSSPIMRIVIVVLLLIKYYVFLFVIKTDNSEEDDHD